MNIPHDALKKNIRNLVCEAFKGDALAKNPPKNYFIFYFYRLILFCASTMTVPSSIMISYLL